MKYLLCRFCYTVGLVTSHDKLMLAGCKAEEVNDRGREQEAAEQNHSQCSWERQDQVSPQKEDSRRSRLIVKWAAGLLYQFSYGITG